MQKSFQIGNQLILLLLFLLMAAWTVPAKSLQIEPVTPVLEVGQSMELLVSGASGIVTWIAANGQIESSGTLVTYIAPEKVGTDIVTVFDGLGNIGTVQISVMPAGNRAAILIHSDAQGDGYNQQQTVDFMAGYAYRSFKARNYDDDEIYLLSYKPDLDINADSQADNVVDAPVNLTAWQNGMAARDLTVADVRAAFNWAKTKGELSRPFVFTFVGHGISNQLLLDSTGNQTLTATELKTILDDYQNVTGNKIVVILEASYSGTFVPILAGTDRVIVSSTGNDLIYYKNLGLASFLKLYFDQLRNGEDFVQAWQAVTDKFAGYMPPFDQQSPQLDDTNAGRLAEGLCLNGCFGGLPGVLTLTVTKLQSIVPMGQPINLNVSTNFASGKVRRVRGALLKPRMTFNRFGHPYQPQVFVSFNQIKRRRDVQEQWQSQVSGEQLTTPGTYTFLFNALDDKDFSADESATFCVESCDPSARLTNISTRAPIQGGANDVIAGFIITGTGTQKVIIRGWGLGAGVDPNLLLQTYPEGKTIAGNNNWEKGQRANEINALPTNLRLTNPTDAGLLLDLPAGAYTAILSSVGSKGRGLIGVNEVETSNTAKLSNISTRAPIQGNADDVIAGFIITGTGNQKVLIRGWGLGDGVNPSITLYSQTGEVMASNNDWQNGTSATEIRGLPQNFQLSESTDAALLLELPVGVYTVRLSSIGAKGLGLIGVNALD